MRNLRQTLSLAFGGLLAVLFVVGLTSILLVARYSATLETIFRENYDTVLYAEEMKNALAELDGIAARSLWVGNEENAAHDAAIAKFESNLRKEQGNVTLPGEAEAAARLQERWAVYKADLVRHLGREAGDPEGFYREVLLREVESAKEAVEHILDMNLANMVSVDGQARAEAVTVRNAMIALMMLGGLLAVALGVAVARSVLGPVRVLTASVGEIERGNLDSLVPVTSTDELGQLAEAFNAMAARLRGLRASNEVLLERTQRATQVALDTFPDAVAVLGTDGSVEMANAAARRLFDLRPGASAIDGHEPVLARIVEQALASGAAFEAHGYEAAIERTDGERRHFQPRIVPMRGHDGNLIGLTLVLSDVTNLRRLDERKSELVSTVSHELKTPLTSIRMATHLLLEGRAGPLTPQQTELLTAAREDSDRLYSIIDDLLDMARMEEGRRGLDLQPIALAVLLEDAVDAHAAAFRSKGVRLAVESHDERPVLADRARLRHVFANLLDNALRHTPAGGTVTVATTARGDLTELSVADTGEGIAEQHLPHVFERFYRAADHSDGAGLGLAIVREIVEMHGGSVAVSSRVGQGSTFRFTLRTVPDAVVGAADDAAGPTGSRTAGRP